MFFVGIDVSQKKLDVVVLLEPDTRKKRQKKVPNTPEGFQTLIPWCQKQTNAPPAELNAVMELCLNNIVRDVCRVRHIA